MSPRWISTQTRRRLDVASGVDVWKTAIATSINFYYNAHQILIVPSRSLCLCKYTLSSSYIKSGSQAKEKTVTDQNFLQHLLAEHAMARNFSVAWLSQSSHCSTTQEGKAVSLDVLQPYGSCTALPLQNQLGEPTQTSSRVESLLHDPKDVKIKAPSSPTSKYPRLTPPYQFSPEDVVTNLNFSTTL